jgi:LysM repeat protein
MRNRPGRVHRAKPPSHVLYAVNASSLHLAGSQYNHAVAIVAACKARGLPVRGAHVALETALTESVLWMYANGNNRRSLQLPHDRVGWDHGSVGLFQQQVGGAPNSTANWGTTDELMHVGTSTGKFLDMLGPLNRWQGKSNWMAAQDVQRSAFSDGSNYKRNDAWAIEIGNALWGATPAAASSPGSAPAVASEPAATQGVYIVLPGDSLSTIAVATGTTVAGLVALNQGSYPSLAHNPGRIEIGWKLRLTGAAQAAPKTAANPPQRVYVVQSGDSLAAIARLYDDPNITWQSIAHANHLANPDLIHPGEKLLIG